MRRRLVAAVALGFAVAACGVLSLEEQLLTRFFDAGRLYDRVALARVATVEWNPAVDGIVRGFTVTRVVESSGRRIVTIEASLEEPGGRMATRQYEAAIERMGGRWLITRLQASRTSRGASSGPPR